MLSKTHTVDCQIQYWLKNFSTTRYIETGMFIFQNTVGKPSFRDYFGKIIKRYKKSWIQHRYHVTV